MTMRLAVADDQADELAALCGVLSDAGHTCSSYGNGDELIAALRRETFDLLLLDWNMPRASGLDVISWVAENITPAPPMIMLTSRDSKADIICALEAGACDFIVKPGDPEIICARVLAASRRRPDAGAEEVVKFGDFEFQPLRRVVKFNGEAVELRAKEFDLARLLFENLNRPLSRAHIMSRIWNSSPNVETRTLDMHISRVRSKLKLRPENGVALRTIFGFGYRLDNCAASDEIA